MGGKGRVAKQFSIHETDLTLRLPVWFLSIRLYAWLFLLCFRLSQGSLQNWLSIGQS